MLGHIIVEVCCLVGDCRLQLPHFLRMSVAVRMAEHASSGYSEAERSGGVGAPQTGVENTALYGSGNIHI